VDAQAGLVVDVATEGVVDELHLEQREPERLLGVDAVGRHPIRLVPGQGRRDGAREADPVERQGQHRQADAEHDAAHQDGRCRGRAGGSST
jgi:hypothetical protein